MFGLLFRLPSIQAVTRVGNKKQEMRVWYGTLLPVTESQVSKYLVVEEVLIESIISIQNNLYHCSFYYSSRSM